MNSEAASQLLLRKVEAGAEVQLSCAYNMLGLAEWCRAKRGVRGLCSLDRAFWGGGGVGSSCAWNIGGGGGRHFLFACACCPAISITMVATATKHSARFPSRPLDIGSQTCLSMLQSSSALVCLGLKCLPALVDFG